MRDRKKEGICRRLITSAADVPHDRRGAADEDLPLDERSGAEDDERSGASSSAPLDDISTGNMKPRPRLVRPPPLAPPCGRADSVRLHGRSTAADEASWRQSGRDDASMPWFPKMLRCLRSVSVLSCAGMDRIRLFPRPSSRRVVNCDRYSGTEASLFP